MNIKTKQWIFPEIRDFSDPQDEMRKKSPNDMDFGDFLWFSPFAAKICIHGFFLIWEILFTALTLYYFFIKESFLGTFIAFAIAFFILFPYEKYRNLFNKTDMNLYDLFVREQNDKI